MSSTKYLLLKLTATFLLLTSGVDSQQQCSALDAANNLYYFPNLPQLEGNDGTVADAALSGSYSTSFCGRTYIYPVSLTQVNCSGTVSAIKYCYMYKGNSRQLGTELLAFTLLTLEQNGRNFRITDRIEIRTTPRSQICTERSSLSQYCCDTTSLNMVDHFILPASNFAYGVAIPPVGVRLLGSNYHRHQVYKPQYQTLNVGSTFVGIQITQGLRILRFHLTPTDAPSTPGTPATTSTPGTPATTSTPGTPTSATTSTPGTQATISTPGTPATTSTPGTPATTSTPGTTTDKEGFTINVTPSTQDNNDSLGAAIGAAVGVLVLVVLTHVIVIAVFRRCSLYAGSATGNSVIPVVQNEAYATTLDLKENPAYGTAVLVLGDTQPPCSTTTTSNMELKENPAYGTSVLVSGDTQATMELKENPAYGTAVVVSGDTHTTMDNPAYGTAVLVSGDTQATMELKENPAYGTAVLVAISNKY